MVNKEFAKINQEFINACEKAGIKATKRQASKYRSKKGIAYKNSR